MTAITGADSIAIIKQASTFGTAVQGGSGDKVILESFTPSRSVTIGTSNSIGGGLSMNQDADALATFDTYSITQQARYDDAGLALLMACFFGASTGSPAEANVGEGDYEHQITHSATADKFVTFAVLTASGEVMEFPSAYVTDLQINSGTTPGYLTYTATFISSKRLTDSTTNTTVSLASATVGGSTKIAHNSLALDNASDNYIRANLASGDALDSDDAVCASEFTLNFSKPREQITTFCTDIYRKTDLFDATVVLNFPRLVDHTWFDVHEAGSLYKMALNIQGAQIGAGDDYKITFNFPKLKVVESPDFSLTEAGENGYSVTYQALGATSAPTGMDSVYPYVDLTTTTSSALIS